MNTSTVGASGSTSTLSTKHWDSPREVDTGLSYSRHSLELNRAEIAEGRVKAFEVVERFNVVEQ